MKKVSTPKVVTTLEATECALPAQIQEALGELVGERGRVAGSASVLGSACARADRASR